MQGVADLGRAGRHAWLGTQVVGYVTGEPAYPSYAERAAKVQTWAVQKARNRVLTGF
jgi:hypothetical protein